MAKLQNATRIFGSATIDTFLFVNGNIASNSTNSGSLQVQGGVGISGGMYVGYTGTFSNAASSISGISGNALQVTAGGIGVSGASYFGSTVSAQGFQAGQSYLGTQLSNNSFDLGQGSLSYGGNTLSSTGVPGWGMRVGSTQNSLNSIANTGVLATSTFHTITGPTLISSAALFTVTNLSVLTINPTTISTTTVVVTNNLALQANGGILINTNTNSISTNSGALQVVGGVGVGGNLYVGSSATIGVAVTNAVVPAVYSNNSLYSSYTSPTISTASAQNLDTYSTSTFRTAKYVVQIYDNGKVHVEEFMLFHDNAIAYLTEYAVATNTGELGSFDANISSGIMTVTFTPNYTPTAMTIKVVRTAITA